MKMFKNIQSKIATLLAAAAFIGCSSDDKVVDFVLDGVNTETPFLRIIASEGTSLDIFDSSSTMTVDLEYQLVPNDPSLDKLQSVEFFVALQDNMDDGTDYSTGPASIGSLSAADFATPGDFGNMTASFSWTLGEAIAALGLSSGEYNGGDSFLLTWNLILTDGTTIGPNDVSGDVAAVGGYYSAQYQLLSFLVCPSPAPSAGTWTIEMYDSYGDGWNGGSLDLIIDGVTYNFFVSEAEGSESIETLEVPAGASAISVIYNGGSWDEEVTFVVISSTGNTLVSGGPSPLTGVELVDTCDDSLDI